MNAHCRSLALALVGWCSALLPADRALWAAAMKAEVAAIEAGDAALSFAVGCVLGLIKERTLTLAFAAQAVRVATLSGMVSLSFLSAMLTERMAGAPAPSALIFGLTSALFAAAAIWSYLRGPLALVRAASSIIPFYIVAYAFLSSERGVTGDPINARLYHALAIEGFVIWAALLACGIFMRRIEARPITNRT